MPECAECDGLCNQTSITLKVADENLRFCSFECLIAHSATRLCRRIARRNRKFHRFIEDQAALNGAKVRRPVKLPLN